MILHVRVQEFPATDMQSTYYMRGTCTRGFQCCRRKLPCTCKIIGDSSTLVEQWTNYLQVGVRVPPVVDRVARGQFNKIFTG